MTTEVSDARVNTGPQFTRNSIEEITKMLASGAPTSLDDTVVRDMKMMDFQIDPINDGSDFTDYSSPGEIWPDYPGSSSPEQDEQQNAVVNNGVVAPIQHQPISSSPLFPQLPQLPFPAILPSPSFPHEQQRLSFTLENEFDSNGGEDVKRKKRKIVDGAQMCPFVPYKHFKHPQYRLLSKEQKDITNQFEFVVRADKNLNYQEIDHAFILYKQNQFQITAELPFLNEKMSQQYFVEAQKGIILPVERFFVGIYAVQQNKRELNLEEDEQFVQIFQTGKSRAKEDNQPAEPCMVKNGTATLTKLRFQSSTSNNARTKNNEPNPNQQYFRLVVTLLAHSSGTYYEVNARISEKLIVRGQNPGRYTSKVKQQPVSSTPSGPNMSTVTNILPPLQNSVHFTWPGPAPAIKTENTTTVFKGKVGVNAENPQQALEVHGNIMVTGNLLKPSDMRVKQNFKEVDSAQQLRNIENLKIYDYELKGWTEPGKNAEERGVIAQDLQRIIPIAVEQMGDVQTKDGQIIQNLLVVNERVLLFENIGATKEIGKILQNELEHVEELDDRVDNMEEEEEKLLIGEAYNRGRIDKVIDYVTQNEYIEDPGSCFYCSIFGLGPAWTSWVIGYIFPPAWVIGVLFLASWSSSARRWAGLANLLSLCLCAIYWYIAWDLKAKNYFPKNEAMGWGMCGMVYLIIGALFMFFLAVYMNKRNRKRRQARESLRRHRTKRYLRRPKLYSYTIDNSSRRLDVMREIIEKQEKEEEKAQAEKSPEEVLVDIALEAKPQKKVTIEENPPKKGDV